MSSRIAFFILRKPSTGIKTKDPAALADNAPRWHRHTCKTPNNNAGFTAKIIAYSGMDARPVM